MAGVEQQDHGCDQFVLAQPAAVAFGGEELADEILARIAAPRAGEAAHIIGEGSRRLGRAILDRAIRAELVHGDHARATSRRAEPHLARNAEEVGDHGDRNGVANSATRSAERLAANASIRSCARLSICGPSFSIRRETKARLTRLRSRVCSGGSSSSIEERSSASNGARCGFESRACPFDDRPAEAAVAQERRDVGETREAPEAVVLPEERRRVFADRGIGRIGVVEEAGSRGSAGRCGARRR